MGANDFSPRQHRRKGGYFERVEGRPAPLVARVERRVAFGEVDPMGILWHGRYPVFFESASAELGRRIGMGYADFRREGLWAPIVQLHVDYLAPLRLDDIAAVRAAFIWDDGARINTEFEIVRGDGVLSARGYTVQLFTSAATNEVLFAVPPLLETCQKRWLAGEFGGLT